MGEHIYEDKVGVGMNSELQLKGNRKILIIGGSSYIGRHLFAQLGHSKAIATYCRNPMDSGIYFDSLSMSLKEIIKCPQEIACAVILIGDTNPDSCARDISKSRVLNVASIKSILESLKYWRIKPIFTSTEFVFDGLKGNYVESDPTNPILTYGLQKVEIENYLQDNFSEFVILRLAKVYGSESNDGTLFTNWLKSIEKTCTIHCAYDQVFSPLYINDLVNGIIKVINQDCNGIFHISGKKAFARIELLEMFLRQIKKYSALNIKINPQSIHDFPLCEKRPLNVSLNTDKLIKAIKLEISDTDQICKEIVDRAFKNNELKTLSQTSPHPK